MLQFDPDIYLEALMRDVLAFGGSIIIRGFDSPRDFMSLPEPLIVNCTGLGAKRLFRDDELTPVKGQLYCARTAARRDLFRRGHDPAQ